MKKSSALSSSLIITSFHLDEAMFNMTFKCVLSIDNDRKPDEVIIVDDCSPYRKEIFSVDKYVWRQTNGGFPECANSGFEAATGDVLILSNNDIEYTPGWLDAILAPLKIGYDISSIRVSDSDGETTENMITDDDYFGSLWAMKRKVYETIGGFDERFKNGTFEDKDFYVRAKDAGFRVAKNHAAFVKHKGRATMDKIYKNQEDFKANAQRFKEKWGYIL